MNQSGLVKMPAATSKIPLPRNLSSSRLEPEISTSINSPPVSKIPVVKTLKTPERFDNNTFSTPNKENVYSGGGSAGGELGSGKKSRIPDIRSKISPARDVHIGDVDGGYKSDHSAKSGVSSSSRIPATSSSKQSRLPSVITTPTSRIPSSGSGSRIPTLSGSSPVKQSTVRSSTESLDDLDWDGDTGVTGVTGVRSQVRHRRSPGQDEVSDLTLSSSSSSYSPHKRRTSPDGESTSPTKSRRDTRGGSPSKIPIAGAYLRGSQEDLLTHAPSDRLRQVSQS